MGASVELRHLRYFVAIAEERSFTRAAERLWVAQPGLSTQIRRLEAELGVKLFDRHTRGVELTEAGELFLRRARTALTAADLAAATGSDLHAGLLGSLLLGIATEAWWRPATELLSQFTRERPGVELTLIEGYGGTLWRDLRDGRLDALLAPAGHASPDLESLELGAAPWVALVGTGHPLAGIGPLPAIDLGDERIAITAHRDGSVHDRAVADLLDDLGVAAELMPGAPGARFYASTAQNQVVALTTAPGALPAGVIARELDPPRVLRFELLWRAEAASPALSAFIDAAAAQAERAPSTRSLTAAA